MQLKGHVLGYDDIATFELSDVIGSYKEDDVLYVRTNFGKTPLIYSTIEPDRSEANESDYEVLRKAGYDPDEVGAQMKAAAEAALARVAPEGGEGEMMISSDLTTILQEAVNLLEIHRFALEDEADNVGCGAGNPDGGSTQDCSHCQLIRDIEEIDQILNKASVVTQKAEAWPKLPKERITHYENTG